MLTGYLALQLAIVVAAVTLFLVERLLPAMRVRTLLRLHYVAAALVVVVALLAPWLPSDLLVAPAAWHAAVVEHDAGRLAAATGHDAGVAGSRGLPAMDALLAACTTLSILAGGCVAWRWIADARRLRRLRQGAQLVRRHGRVRIWALDHAHSPFSFRGWRHAHVFIPQFVVARPDWYRMAIAHELQHHRQGDTAWLYLIGLLRVSAAANPFTWAWTAAVARLQELACDAALLDRRRWPAAAYAQGLLDVARAAAPHRGAAWAPSLTGRQFSLKRRIEHMMEQKGKPPGVAARAAAYAGLLAALGFSAVAASSLNSEPAAGAAGHGAQPQGALPIRAGAVAAPFEIPEEGATRRTHAGVDIAAPAGTPVYAWQQGVVVHAGPRKGCGTAVVLQHSQDTRTLYCNLDRLRVTAGESVGRDQSLGVLADLGTRQKSHLHFEIEIDGRNVDPARQVDLPALK
jgi:beta-lactamase regulating signal transducer with metallopeptidase domain